MVQLETSAVVFDAVGTLIYPEPCVAAAYASAGRRFGSKLSEAEIARRFHAVFREVETRDRSGDLRTSEGFEYARWREIVHRVLDDVDDYVACFAELFKHFGRALSWRVFADVPPVFAALATSGITVAIASNFDERLIGIARELPPLDRCPHVLVSSQIGYRKPHPRFFEAVVATLGIATHKVLYVGDDPTNDMAGAEAVGIRTLLVRRAGEVPRGGLEPLTELVSRRNRA